MALSKKASLTDRLFIGTFPTGISYADKQRERHGDYMRIAFLPFSTLELEWSPGRHPPELRKLVEQDATQMVKRRGQAFQVSSAGQTVTLGRRHHATMKAPTKLKIGGTATYVGSNLGSIRPGDRVRIIRLIGTAARIIPASVAVTSKQAMRTAFARDGWGVDTDFLISD